MLKVSQLVLWNAHSNVKYFPKCHYYKGNEKLISTLILWSVLLKLKLPDHTLLLARQELALLFNISMRTWWLACTLAPPSPCLFFLLLSSYRTPSLEIHWPWHALQISKSCLASLTPRSQEITDWTWSSCLNQTQMENVSCPRNWICSEHCQWSESYCFALTILQYVLSENLMIAWDQNEATWPVSASPWIFDLILACGFPSPFSDS